MRINYNVTSYPRYKEYFYIKYTDGTILKLEELYQRLKNQEITHNVLLCYEYIYRGQKYSYKELANSNVISLKLPRFYNEKTIKQEFFNCFSKEDGYVIRLIQTLDRYLNKARFEAIKASTILDLNYLNADYNIKNYDFQYVQRCMCAENSIYSYYAVFEILMLIIWIIKDYHKIKQCKSFDNVCAGFKCTELFNKLETDDAEFVNFFGCIQGKKLIINSDFERIRTWCNKFKHRGILRFDGEREENKPIVAIKFDEDYRCANNCSDFSSNDYDYEYIDLDNEVIPEIVRYHNCLIALIEKVFKKLGMES